MTYSLIIGGTEEFALASTLGWYDFKSWIDKLNVEIYPQLIHLVDWGWCQELDALLLELKLALVASPPQSPTVDATLRSLVDALMFSSDDATSLFVSDGMGPDNKTAAEAQEEYDVEYQGNDR